MKQENEFVLPEKWCIKGCKELGDFMPNTADVYGNRDNFYYYRNTEDNLSWSINLNIKIGFKEITFEQFKEYVLKEIPKPEYDPKDVAFNQRKIIGYKLIKPEYKEAVRAILKLTGTLWLFDKYFAFSISFSAESVRKTLEESGILELWFEPVYDASITLKSGVKLSEDDIAEVKEILNNK